MKALLLKLIVLPFHLFPPRISLRMLMKLDGWLYYLQGQAAIRYGNGVHPKHRLMNYHRFFTQRITAGQQVLDVGCNIGAVAYDIATECQAHVTGIDIIPSHIEKAKKRFVHPNVTYLVGDATTYEWDQSVDVVVLSNVLEHIAKRPEFLERLVEAIQPKYFLIRVPLFERDWRVPLKKELDVEWRLDPTHETEYTLESFRDEMKAANLEINHLEVRWSEIWAQLSPKQTPTHD